MDINKYKRVREQKVIEERNDISNEYHNLSSTKLSIDHKASMILDFSRVSSTKNLNIKRQRLHQLILCVKFFNEQINLQRQIISSYNNIENNNNGNNSGNIYKRKKRDLNVNNNVNNSSTNINDNIYLKSCLLQEFENSKQKCLIDYNAKINEKKEKLKENKEKVKIDCDFIIKNLEESKDIYLLEYNDMKQNLVEKEKSDLIIQNIKDNVREYSNTKQFVYSKYYKEFMNKIEKPKKVTHHFKLNTKGVFNVKPYESSQNSRRSRNEDGLSSSSKSINITKTHRKIKIGEYHSKTKGVINKKAYKK